MCRNVTVYVPCRAPNRSRVFFGHTDTRFGVPNASVPARGRKGSQSSRRGATRAIAHRTARKTRAIICSAVHGRGPVDHCPQVTMESNQPFVGENHISHQVGDGENVAGSETVPLEGEGALAGGAPPGPPGRWRKLLWTTPRIFWARWESPNICWRFESPLTHVHDLLCPLWNLSVSSF